MTKRINIHRTGEQVDLKSGKYSIYVIGGWRVKLGNFSISLRHSETQQIIDSERAFWPVQRFAFDKRAKRILVVHIPRSGAYIVEFRNPESLKVKPSNLFITPLFQDPVPNENLEIIFS